MPEQACLILGRADEMRAEVHVRHPGLAGDARMGGTLTGPLCATATTLPTTIRLVDAGLSGDAPAARAILTEPSYWTPDLPNLYRLDLEVVEAGGRTWRPPGRLVGLRRLGVRGRSFWLDGRRWVPRAVPREPARFVADASALHAEGLAAFMADPTDEACGHADSAGVAVVALLADARGRPLDHDRAIAAIARWAAHPAVVLAVVPQAADATALGIAARSRGIRQTLLVALEVDGGRPPDAVGAMPPAAVDALVVRVAEGMQPHASWRAAAFPVPLVAWRTDAAAPRDSRRGCDRLQADLAAWGTAAGATPAADWAGYIVS